MFHQLGNGGGSVLVTVHSSNIEKEEYFEPLLHQVTCMGGCVPSPPINNRGSLPFQICHQMFVELLDWGGGDLGKFLKSRSRKLLF